MKKLTTILLLGTFSLFNSGIIEKKQPIEEMLNSKGYCMHSDFYGGKDKTYTFNKRIEAENKLRKLTGTSIYESAYMFVPEVNLLINNTVKQEIKKITEGERTYYVNSVSASIKLREKVKEKLKEDLDSITINSYHVHIDHYLVRFAGDTIINKQCGVESDTSYQQLKKFFIGVEEAKPSDVDLTQATKTKSVSRYIISKHGTTNYKLNSVESAYDNLRYEETSNGFILTNDNLWIQFRRKEE